MSITVPLIIAVVMVVVVLVMLRNGRLREKYAILWLVIGTLTIILGLFPGLLNWAASLVGVVVPSNLLFALSILLLVGVSLHVSRELTILEDETRILAEEVAILRSQVDQLRATAEQSTVASQGTSAAQPGNPGPQNSTDDSSGDPA